MMKLNNLKPFETVPIEFNLEQLNSKCFQKVFEQTKDRAFLNYDTD